MKILPFLVHFGSILSVVGNIENIINVEKIHTNYNETITELLGKKINISKYNLYLHTTTERVTLIFYSILTI